MRDLVFLVAHTSFQRFIFLLQSVVADGVGLGIILHESASQYGLPGQFQLLGDFRLLVQAILHCGLGDDFQVDEVIANRLANFRGVRLALLRCGFEADVHAFLRDGYAVDDCCGLVA